jgi:hypothetical protein
MCTCIRRRRGALDPTIRTSSRTVHHAVPDSFCSTSPVPLVTATVWGSSLVPLIGVPPFVPLVLASKRWRCGYDVPPQRGTKEVHQTTSVTLPQGAKAPYAAT